MDANEIFSINVSLFSDKIKKFSDAESKPYLKSSTIREFGSLTRNIEHAINQAESPLNKCIYHFFLATLFAQCPVTYHYALPDIAKNTRIEQTIQHYYDAFKILQTINHPEVNDLLESIPELIRVQLKLFETTDIFFKNDRKFIYALYDDVLKNTKSPAQKSYSQFFKPAAMALGGAVGLASFGALGLIAGVAAGFLGHKAADTLSEECCKSYKR